MSKKLILVFVFAFFLVGVRFACAEVVINEIMYAPTQNNSYNEWIEIYNPGDTIDLTNLLICDNPVAAGYIKHSDGSLNQNNGLILNSGGFAIVTDGGSGTEAYSNFPIPDSVLSLHVNAASMCGGLGNDGDVITISGSNNSSVDYAPYADKANGNGNSLQLMTDGTWKACGPTPGSATLPTCGDTSGGGGGGGGGDTGGSTSSGGTTPTPETKPKVVEPKIKTEIVAEPVVYVGKPFTLEGKTLGYQGEQLFAGKYFWNFGDGDSRQVPVTYNEKFSHTYFYPGEYPVILEYYSNYSVKVPNATDKITIKVIVPGITISSVGPAEDFFIEIGNDTAYETDLSGWFLVSGQKNFLLPRGTVLGAKKKIIIPPGVSNFSIADKNNLTLMNAGKEIVFSLEPAPSRTLAKVEIVSPAVEPIITASAENLPTSPIVGFDKSAGAINSGITLPIISFVFIGTAAGAVYFIRRKKVVPNPGNEFEILDE